MSEIGVNKVIDEAGTGAVELTHANTPSGKTISGSGTIAVNSSGAADLLGHDITVGNIVGAAATFSGVLTYSHIER